MTMIMASRVWIRVEIDGMDVDCPVCGDTILSGRAHECTIEERVIQVDRPEGDECEGATIQ